MKKLLLILLAAFVGASLQAQPPDVPAEKGSKFGEEFTVATTTVDANALTETLAGKDSALVQVRGVVNAVCTKEGCWMKLAAKDGSKMVKMKDHAFLVPVAINGKEVVVNAVAFKKTTSVKELRHYAEDAGKTKAEIEKITEPKHEIVLQAKGIEVL